MNNSQNEYWSSTIIRIVSTSAFILLVAYTGSFILSTSVLAIGWIVARMIDIPKQRQIQDEMKRNSYNKYYKPFFEDALDYDEYKRTGKRRRSELTGTERGSDQ